ncbi:hypothetical protein F5883DRAFT_233731 [Diaporthe sp. PMI_573]|nr:hypothetical protein F5883DRAFT_233731 [Diaporthaceae sp. PMI_573]
MYRPDELPQITVDGGDKIQGRQPYHGEDELIASNHMDIINVVSVTEKTTVNHFDEDNHDQVQNSFYWRQIFNIQTRELSVSTWAECLYFRYVPYSPESHFISWAPL